MSYNNSSNVTWSIGINFRHLAYSYYALYSVSIVFGIAFNLWLLGAILTSPEMRGTMRNKLVGLMTFNNLIRSGVVSLTEIIQALLYIEASFIMDCRISTVFRILRFCFMWVENWYVLIFFVHYIYTQLDLNSVKYLSQRQLQIGTNAVLAGPWIFTFIVGPAVLVGHHHARYGAHSKGCVYYTIESFKAMSNFGIVTPYFVKLGLIILIFYLNYRRKVKYSSMSSSLIGPNTHIDDVKPYFVLYALIAVTQSLLVVGLIVDIWSTDDYFFNIVFYFASWFLSEFRCFLMVFAFIAFDDIRTRLKTWRPWYRPGPGIDLTVQYNQTKDDSKVI